MISNNIPEYEIEVKRHAIKRAFQRKMKTCTECNGEMIVLKDESPEGYSYKYYRCKKCGNEVLDMAQLDKLADKYRKTKRYNAKLTKWGKSLGLRIPKELTKHYNLKDKKEVAIIPEKKGMRIIPV